jgi:LuxR family transcriptional regulator, maltose regulon positive regulatory protein
VNRRVTCRGKVLCVTASATAEPGTARITRFALAKFRPTTLPTTLVTRPILHSRLTQGASQRLTVVVGSAGAGKSVLLSSWAAARPPGLTSWLSCDGADADPVRFWAAFIEAPRAVEPGFGADAADLLAMDGVMSADVTASIANDAAKLPCGTAIVVDDFHYAAPEVSGYMSDLVERWPAEAAQLVLASRFDPPLRLHRMRMSGELCEFRDRDLYFSLAESGDLLANFGVNVAAAQLALVHQRSEGWAAALQMAALSLRASRDPVRAAHGFDVHSHAIAEYFIAEVLDRQPPEIAQFMLETSVLGTLTAEACAAVTGRHDAAALLRHVHVANLFLVPIDDEQTAFRYHCLVGQVLHAELRARDHGRELVLQSRAAEWFESTGDLRRAARHFLAAKQVDRGLTLMRDGVLAGYLRDPVLPATLDLSMVSPSSLAEAPERLLAISTDLLTSGDTVLGGQYLEMLERVRPSIPASSALAAQFAVLASFRRALAGQADEALSEALAARAIQDRTPVAGVWETAVPLTLIRVHTWLEDYPAVEREATALLAMPQLTEPVKQVLLPGAWALAWFEDGRVADAASAATAAASDAHRLGFTRHFFAVDYLRTLAGVALERRDLDTAEQLTEQVLSISERRRRPVFEFLAMLDRAGIWATRGHFHESLATVEAARKILAGTGSILLSRADELEALIRLSLGDLRTPARLAVQLPTDRRALLQARLKLAEGDHHAAQKYLDSLPPDGLTGRRALIRQLLLTAVAITRGDPMTASIMAGAVQMARREGFLNTVVTVSRQVTGYIVEHSADIARDPFMERLIEAAIEVRAVQLDVARSRHAHVEPLTAAELRILKLLPTGSYAQMATTLYISRNTVKTHLRAIYQKLGATSRSEALERAVALRLL